MSTSQRTGGGRRNRRSSERTAEESTSDSQRKAKGKRGEGAGTLPDNPMQGGFGKLLLVAVALVGLAAMLWFMTPWSKPGHTHMQVDDSLDADGPAAAGLVVETVVEADGSAYVRTTDGRTIPVNTGLPQQIIVVERDGEEVARFVAEVADTPRAQQVGLMGRDELAPDRAMLFTWEPPNIIAMWMKDTLISLDFLYVRPGGVIVAIGHEVPPCPAETVRCPAYSAPEPVAHVLEIAGGRARELGLRPGDRLVALTDTP